MKFWISWRHTSNANKFNIHACSALGINRQKKSSKIIRGQREKQLKDFLLRATALKLAHNSFSNGLTPKTSRFSEGAPNCN